MRHQRKLEGLALLLWKMRCTNIMSKWIVQAILLGQSNMQILLMYCIKKWRPSSQVYGALVPFGCPLQTFLSKACQKNCIILLGHGRWWHVTVIVLSLSCLEDILQLSFGGKVNIKGCTLALLWTRILYSTLRDWGDSMIFGIWEGNVYQIFPCRCLSWLLGQTIGSLWFVSCQDAQWIGIPLHMNGLVVQTSRGWVYGMGG